MIDKPVMIITGTRKGIGKYLAEYYIEKGFIVIGSSRGDNGFKMNNYLKNNNLDNLQKLYYSEKMGS